MTSNIVYMPNYRLHVYARRASIQIGTMHKAVSLISPETARFSRCMTDGIALEKSPPIQPLWKDIAAGLAVVLMITVLAMVS